MRRLARLHSIICMLPAQAILAARCPARKMDLDQAPRCRYACAHGPSSCSRSFAVMQQAQKDVETACTVHLALFQYNA